MAQKEKEAFERRKAEEEAKLNKSAMKIDLTDAKATSELDDLLKKINEGVIIGKHSRRNRRAKGKPGTSLRVNVDGASAGGERLEIVPLPVGDKTADLARDMLAALKSDGFEAFTPTTSKFDRDTRRKSRKRLQAGLNMEEIVASPTMSEDRVQDGSEATEDLGAQPELSPLPSSPGEEEDESAPGDRTITLS